MTPETFSFTKIYAFDEVSPSPIVVDHRFRHNTITVQPLNIPTPPMILDESLLSEGNAVLTGCTGSVSFLATPPASYIKYTIPDSTVLLSAPSFINTSIPIFKLHPSFESVTGCTHIAITVTGFTS